MYINENYTSSQIQIPATKSLSLPLKLWIQHVSTALIILDCRMLDVLKNSGVVIVNSSEEARIKVTLIKCDKMSHVKGRRNSCSLANFVGVEWSRRSGGNEET